METPSKWCALIVRNLSKCREFEMHETELKKIYDGESSEYDGRYQKKIHKVEDQIVAHVLGQLYREGDKVLDVGSGTGMVAKLGQILPADYLGIDLSQEMVETARRTLPDHSFRHGDAGAYQEMQFDLVTAVYGPLNYMGIHRFMRLLKNVLKPDGKVLAIVYTGAENPDVAPPSDLYTVYPAQRLADEFEGAGLNVEIRGFSYLGGKRARDIGNEYYSFQLGKISLPFLYSDQLRYKYMIVSSPL
jgi:ubiquinone/menaquinone biosynthesis C-methylase UbiE